MKQNLTPEVHEGVEPGEGFSMQDHKVPAGTILFVKRNGYLRGDHVLRPAQVVVKKVIIRKMDQKKE